MRTLGGLAFVGLGVLLTGCGPSIGKSVMLYAPARPADCDIKVVNVGVQDLGPGSEWDTLGMLVVSGGGSGDPFAPEKLSELRPDACGMGGEAMALGNSASNGVGTTTMYTVLKKKASAPSAPPAASAEPAANAQ